MGEKETMTGAGLIQNEAARSQFEKQHLGGMVQDEAARSQHEKMNTGGMVQDEAARSQYEKMHLERQTPERDFGDRMASGDDGASGPAESGRVRLDPTPARISTNMSIERQKAGLDSAGGMLAGGAAQAAEADSTASQATSGLKDTLKTQV